MDDIQILLIDDDEDFISALTERLDLQNLVSETVLNNEQVLNYVGENEPDVIIIDLKLFHISRLNIVRLLKKKYPYTQIIIQTEHGDDLDEAEARQLGVFDYLRKPIEIEALVDRIKAASQTRNYFI